MCCSLLPGYIGARRHRWFPHELPGTVMGEECAEVATDGSEMVLASLFQDTYILYLWGVSCKIFLKYLLTKDIFFVLFSIVIQVRVQKLLWLILPTPKAFSWNFFFFLFRFAFFLFSVLVLLKWFPEQSLWLISIH